MFQATVIYSDLMKRTAMDLFVGSIHSVELLIAVFA
jgi:hypothetical protein